jgi:hypothetical protein
MKLIAGVILILILLVFVCYSPNNDALISQLRKLQEQQITKLKQNKNIEMSLESNTVRNVNDYMFEYDYNKLRSKLSELKTDMDIRIHYNEAISKLFSTYEGYLQGYHLRNMKIPEILVKHISNTRNEIKGIHREYTSTHGRRCIKLYKVLKYDNTEPTYDYLISKGKSPEYILYSSFKTNNNDDCTANKKLSNLIDIVADTLNTDDPIYPELVYNEYCKIVKSDEIGKKDYKSRFVKMIYYI